MVFWFSQCMLVGILLYKELFLLLHVFLNLFTYFYQYEFMDFHFILWVIICNYTYLLIFLFKLSQIWPLGVSSSWPRVLLKYLHLVLSTFLLSGKGRCFRHILYFLSVPSLANYTKRYFQRINYSPPFPFIPI